MNKALLIAGLFALLATGCSRTPLSISVVPQAQTNAYNRASAPVGQASYSAYNASRPATIPNTTYPATTNQSVSSYGTSYAGVNQVQMAGYGTPAAPNYGTSYQAQTNYNPYQTPVQTPVYNQQPTYNTYNAATNNTAAVQNYGAQSGYGFNAGVPSNTARSNVPTTAVPNNNSYTATTAGSSNDRRF